MDIAYKDKPINDDSGSDILFEKLSVGQDVIAERHQSQITLNGITIPAKFSAKESLVHLFENEEKIRPIHEGFKKVNIIESNEKLTPSPWDFDSYKQSIQDNYTLELIQKSYYPMQHKLLLAYKSSLDNFEGIKDNFINLFPQVENLRIIETIQKFSEVNQLTATLEIKEKGVEKWISQNDISAGMLKSLLLIGYVYLSPPGTVILMDEFENSLGVNCIDIFENIPYESYDLQFIITSHHPYIINNVPMLDWKIVTRKGSVVTVKDASQFNLGKSKHTAFNQLLQLDEFNEGIILP